MREALLNTCASEGSPPPPRLLLAAISAVAHPTGFALRPTVVWCCSSTLKGYFLKLKLSTRSFQTYQTNCKRAEQSVNWNPWACTSLTSSPAGCHPIAFLQEFWNLTFTFKWDDHIKMGSQPKVLTKHCLITSFPHNLSGVGCWFCVLFFFLFCFFAFLESVFNKCLSFMCIHETDCKLVDNDCTPYLKLSQMSVSRF